jgi:Microtubule associated protein (MAP65/ASE1 family)
LATEHLSEAIILLTDTEGTSKVELFSVKREIKKPRERPERPHATSHSILKRMAAKLDLTQLSIETTQQLSFIWNLVGVPEDERQAFLQALAEKVRAQYTTALESQQERQAAIEREINELQERIKFLQEHCDTERGLVSEDLPPKNESYETERPSSATSPHVPATRFFFLPAAASRRSPFSHRLQRPPRKHACEGPRRVGCPRDRAQGPP